MALALSLFLAQVDGLIAALETELSQVDRYRLIKAAVAEYSNDRPLIVWGDVTGDAGKYYPLTGVGAVLSQWVEGFSRVVSIQYPAPTIASDETPIYLEPENWDDNYWASSIRYLFLPNHAPAATETMRIGYACPYPWTKSTTLTTSVAMVAHGFALNDYIYLGEDSKWTLATDQRIATHQVSAVGSVDAFTANILDADPPTSDFFAICSLAAAKCCLSISTKYSRSNDSTIRADSVDHASRGANFAYRYKDFLTQYRSHMGLDKSDDKEIQGAGAFADWDTEPTLSDRKWLFHTKGR